MFTPLRSLGCLTDEPLLDATGGDLYKFKHTHESKFTYFDNRMDSKKGIVIGLEISIG